MRKPIISTLTAVLLVFAGTAVVEAQGVPWNDHANPFTFLFDNHIDDHQQSRVSNIGNQIGQFYIQFTTETIDGIPVAEHGQDLVGWMIRGTPVVAKLLSTNPLSWCVEPNLIPRSPGYTHFHWIGSPGFTVGTTYEGYLQKLTATGTFYFRHEGTSLPILVTPGIDYASHANVSVCS